MAIIFENEVLLSSIRMQELDVIVHPLKEQLVVNPENPNIPKYK
jgi:hypothetical protein